MWDELNTLRSLRKRDILQRVMQVSLIIGVALCLWRAHCLVTHCDASLVVVLSGSMEPGYRRGDVLFLHHSPHYPVQVGDIVVFNLEARAVPIVHRVIRIHQRESDGKRFLLTKGDNNAEDDRNLYPLGTEWIADDQIVGKTFAYVPWMGYITIAFNESVIVKYLALGVIGFFMITSTEE